MKEGVIILRSNEVDPDPRVEKTAKWLSERYSVIILAWNRTMKSKPKECIADTGVIYRQSNPAAYGSGVLTLFALIKFNCWILNRLFKHRKSYAIIHACDLDTVIPGLIIARLFKKKLVYDIFDYFSAARGLEGFSGKLVSHLENFCIRKSGAIIIVDQCRYAQLKTKLPQLHAIVYNVPDLPEQILAQPVHINRIVYVGILQDHRFLKELCTVISKMPQWELYLAGFGALEEYITAQAQTYANIKYLGRISYQEGIELSKSAKVMIAIYDPELPNHQYASPNKFFEAMALGKIIIAANNTSIDKKVKSNKLGYTFDYHDKKEFAQLLFQIEKLDSAALAEISNNARLTSRRYYSPLIQKEKLILLYNKINDKSNQFS
jgi:glycosyltransferase involved in cell wall biosynthesis